RLLEGRRSVPPIHLSQRGPQRFCTDPFKKSREGNIRSKPRRFARAQREPENLFFNGCVSSGKAPRGRLDDRHRLNPASFALGHDERQDGTVGAANEMCRFAQENREVISLLLKPEAPGVGALSMATPVDDEEPVTIGELALLDPRVLAAGEAAVNHDNWRSLVAP